MTSVGATSVDAASRKTYFAFAHLFGQRLVIFSIVRVHVVIVIMILPIRRTFFSVL